MCLRERERHKEDNGSVREEESETGEEIQSDKHRDKEELREGGEIARGREREIETKIERGV